MATFPLIAMAGVESSHSLKHVIKETDLNLFEGAVLVRLEGEYDIHRVAGVESSERRVHRELRHGLEDK